MAGARKKKKKRNPGVSPDALLCALVIAPGTFPRNRFYGLFEDPVMKRTRRRAYHVRSVLKQLAAKGKERAEVIGRLELDDRRVLLRYKVASVRLERTTALSQVESAALNFALHRAGVEESISEEDRAVVEQALGALVSDMPGLTPS